MSEGVTEALRGWIRAYDLWLNEGEGEAPTVDSLCEVADAIDLATQDEVAYALAQAMNDGED